MAAPDGAHGGTERRWQSTRHSGRAAVIVVAVLSLTLGTLSPMPSAAAGAASPSPARDDVVIVWNEALLEAVRRSPIGPPMVARALAVAHTCMFDAWAAYDQRAVGTRLGGSLRRPAKERNVANKATAVSFAAYRAAVDLFPKSRSAVFDPLMARLGHDPSTTTNHTATPASVGNVACRAVLDYRHRDGANQLGDEPGGAPGVGYSDYTGYVPANAPMDTRSPFDPPTVVDPDRW
ncbi:MAG: hypothetical protein M3396_05575 [Actinomycetota bacterium]|nr:hypothetical protein [Actinomycetota bacterium]